MYLLFWQVKLYLLILQTLPLELVKAKPRIVEFFSGSLFWGVNQSNFPSKGSVIMLHAKGFYFVANIQAVTSRPQTVLLHVDRYASNCLLWLFLHRNQKHKKNEPENSMLRNQRLPPSTSIITYFPCWPCRQQLCLEDRGFQESMSAHQPFFGEYQVYS